jgi:ethanolamine ammonia-lyase large subunit
VSTPPDEIRRTFVLANAFKEGDLSVGGTRDDQLRAEARGALLGVTVGDIRRTVFVDDGVTEALQRGRDRSLDAELDPLTIRELRDRLLAPRGEAWVRTRRQALPSEVIAAAAKVMTDAELSTLARMLFNPLPGRDVTVGGARHFGSRIQPNSPGDDETEILFSVLEGLTYGCGDVIIGLNPASDDVDTIVRLERLLERVVERLQLPTRYCVLSDIVKQRHAQARARVDVGFQSLAGTSAALAGMVGLDVPGILEIARGFDGLYFETGQGSAVTNGTAEGVDMVTLEARAYGVARHLGHETGAWMIVNDVAGFIGPEVFRTAAQLERACLEDSVMAKLHGLTMGLDVCTTFHTGIPPSELAEVTARVVDRAAPAYLMAVAGNADPMLGYLTTSFREHPGLRRRAGRAMTTVMEERLRSMGTDIGGLYSAFCKAGGDTRTATTLSDEARRTVSELQERGFDLGFAAGDVSVAAARLDAIYENARRALYAQLDEGVLHDACPRQIQVRTIAADRDEYLAHPPQGERLHPRDAAAVRAVYPSHRPQAQFVVSDGLNADAVNEHLRELLPAARRRLADTGCVVGDVVIVVRNGRVRAGYHVAQLLDVPVVVHLLGERPGTGLNTLSAYLTYGRDARGQSRWTPALDHACTTAVCGIHPKGKTPEVAAAEIVRLVGQMLEQRCSGVLLSGRSYHQ